MALILKLALLILFLYCIASAGLKDPFPLGSSMCTQGTLVHSEGMDGRQPWIPSAFYNDSTFYGIAACGASYYGGINEGALLQYGIGGFLRRGHSVLKLALLQMDVMGIYFEQSVLGSAGFFWNSVAFSVEARSMRLGLGETADIRAFTALGASVTGYFSFVEISLLIDGLTVESSGERSCESPPQVKTFFQTRHGKYGAQGLQVDILPNQNKPLRFALAQEYRMNKSITLSAALSSNPTMISFGVKLELRHIGASVAAVNHPLLGWSRGFSADFYR